MLAKTPEVRQRRGKNDNENSEGLEVDATIRAPLVATAGPATGGELPALIEELLDRSFQCLLSVNRDQKVVCFNEASEKTFGYSRAEVIGKPLHALLPMPKRADHDDVIAQIFDRLVDDPGSEFNACIPCIRRDGSHFRANLVARISTAAAEPLMIATIEDIAEKQRRTDELRNVYALNRALARRLLAQEEERRHAIARELHDDVGQLATSLAIDLQLLSGELDVVTEMPRHRRVERMLRIVRDLHDSLRNCVQELRPDVLDGASLREAIIACADRLGLQQLGVLLTLHIAPDIDRGMQDLARVNVFRFVQEALTNIARHALARNVSISVLRGVPPPPLDEEMRKCCPFVVLDESHRIVTLDISDDGHGFDFSSISRTSNGLRNMRERVAAMGGVLQIDSSPGNGCRLQAAIVEERRS